MSIGAIYALLAYIIWGLFPAYWKQISAVPATQIIGHRIVWSFLFMLALTTASKGTGRLKAILADKRTVGVYSLVGALLAGNWLTYVWAVNNGHVVEASLGYFISPLLNVLLGLLVLKERLYPRQWAAIALATAGVVYLTATYGRLPWIALLLAGTFGLYALLTKTAALDAAEGLTLATGAVFLPALAFLIWQEAQGKGAFLHAGIKTSLMLAGGGAVTAVPLLLFMLGVRRAPLSVVGLLQYVAPSLQFLLGVFAYGENFTAQHLVGYALVWAALAIFGADALMRGNKE